MEARIKKGEAMPATETLLALGELAPDSEKAKIRTMHLAVRTPENKPRKPLVGEAQSLRERILSASLFPNIYNQKYTNSSS